MAAGYCSSNGSFDGTLYYLYRLPLLPPQAAEPQICPDIIFQEIFPPMAVLALLPLTRCQRPPGTYINHSDTGPKAAWSI